MFVHNEVRNRLQPSRAEDLVYIYTNSRLLRHRRGPNPVQWYGIYQIHSDDELDEEALDGDDPGGHPDIDANMADNDDIGGDAYGFDTGDSSDTAYMGDDSDFGGGGGSREYNGVGSQSDGGGGGGGADLGVFDFCKGEDQPHATAPVPPVDDEPRDAPSIAMFSVAEDIRQARHASSLVVTNPTTDAVEHSDSASDSLDFGDAGEGGNIHQECNPSIVEPPDQINAPSRAASPSVPPTTITALLPSRLQHTPRLCTIPSPNHPLTRSVANQRGIGHTLLMACAIPRNNDVAPMCPRPSSEIVPTNMDSATRSFPSSSTIEEYGLVSAIGIATRTRTTARIAMPSTLPSISAVRIGVGQLNSPSSLPRAISHSDASLEPPRLRTTRGAKNRRRYQGQQTPFVGDDYDVANGMPHLDEYGIRDVESSQRTKKLITSRGSLRLRSMSP